MEGGRFLPSRENPRSLGFPSANNKEIPVEMIQKPLTPILDRFKALLKDREEELRVSDDDDDILQPSAEDIVLIYEIVLSELTANSKPIITELTIIAGEQKEYAEGIADAICTRIVEAPSEQKLPSLYLLDSIVKNIGDEYITYFALRLPEVFCEAYRKVQPNQYRAMRHLFRTWSTVFPLSALETIEAELKFSPVVNNQSSASASLRSDESPSPRPAHGIHVNPKYLEARRQFEQAAAVNMPATDRGSIAACLTSFKGERMERNASATSKGWSGASSQFDEVEDARGISSNLPRYGQKTFEHDQYDIDHAEVSNQIAIRRLRSPSIVTMAGAEKLRVGATELLPSGDGFPNNNSPRRIAEYGPGRANRKEGERNEWWTKHTSDSEHQHVGTYHPYHLSHGSDQERPRALIDAYGNYRGESIPNEKPMKIERLDMNGMKSDTTAKSWQNTEEEEYVWEDMSPTLDRSRSNHLMGLGPPLGNISTRTGSGRPGAVLSETNFRVGSWPRLPQVPVADDSAIIAENGSSHLGSGRGVIGEKPLFGLGVRYEATQRQGSNYSPEPWNSQHHFPPSFQHHRAKAPSFPSSGPVLSVCQRQPSLMDNMDVLSSITPATMAEKQLLQKPCSPPMASHVWPPVNVGKYRPLPPFPILPQHKLMKGQFSLLDANKPLINEGPNDFPQQQFDAVDRNPLDSTNLLQLPHQLGGLTSLNGQSQGQVAPPMPQFLRSQQAEESSVQRILPQAPSHLAGHPFSHVHPLQGHGPYVPPNGLPSVPIHNASNNSFQFQGGQLPPLPPGPPPASLQMVPSSQSMGPLASQPPGGGAFSGLISSLMAQGLISLTKPVPTQDSVGVEFNVDVLKVRHESAIRALYADLPRQCTTCGLRFKGQEEHSAHMDWHVTKNRISRNRKQKPSRNWFVSTSVWLSTAEALGSEAAPGFLSTESVIEKKDDEEMAVPADDNQNACALCGELFDDFYSDETEEWMYRGAVYLNAHDGSTEGIDRSQLGPIVHAKCRSETTVVSTEDFGLQEGGTGEDDSQRKRMRV